MPYIIVKSKTGNKNGYRVRKKFKNTTGPLKGKYHYFSKKPLTKRMASQQLKALYVHATDKETNKRTKKTKKTEKTKRTKRTKRTKKKKTKQRKQKLKYVDNAMNRRLDRVGNSY